jgi:hypothetical protein
LVIAKVGDSQADLLPAAVIDYDAAQQARLSGAYFHERFMSFQFDDEITDLEALCEFAMPLQYADLVYVGGELRDCKFIYHCWAYPLIGNH